MILFAQQKLIICLLENNWRLYDEGVKCRFNSQYLRDPKGVLAVMMGVKEDKRITNMTSHEPILKTHWERYKTHFPIDNKTVATLVKPYAETKITNFILLSEGCVNSNYKVEFEIGPPVVLRIYLREKDSLQIEIALHQLLNDQLPIPEMFYSDASCTLIEHPYAIMEFLDGELMRNVILSKNETAIKDCTFSAGVYLDHLRQIKLEQCGFFQADLQIKPFDPGEEYLPYAQSCLENENVCASLGKKLIGELQSFIIANQSFLPGKTDANLTHADFDPANMLVKKIKGHYQVSGILDWEYAFSSSYLLDIGMFLRYSHKLPRIYENSFIEGITSEGHPLPLEWRKSAKLMDLICLLSMLYWNPKKDRPNLTSDVVGLILNTLKRWDSY